MNYQVTSAAVVIEPQLTEIAVEQKPPVKKAFFYLPELDGLRTVGFLYMFMAHSSIIPQPHGHFFLTDWYNVFVKWGVIGLDMFFVLSGYLITTLLLKERLKNGNISLPLYFKRRMLRIWPLFYLVIFVGAVIPFVSTRHLDMQLYQRFLGEIFLPMFFFLGNYALIFKAYTLQALTAGLNFPLASLFRPLWSVCSEEQFYVTWPFVVRKAKTWQGLTCIIAGLTVMSMCFRFYFQQYSLTHTQGIWTPSDFYHYNTLCGLDTLMAGALIATVQLQLPKFWEKTV